MLRCAALCYAVLCCAVLTSLSIQPLALASGLVKKAVAMEKSLLSFAFT